MSAEAATSNGTTERKARIQRPNKEQFDKELAELQAELAVKDKALETAKAEVNKAQPSKGGPAGSEREQLLKELDAIKEVRDKNKSSRDKLMDEIRVVDEQLKRKIKDLQTARTKSPYKSTEEIDAQITKLEKLVDSGSLRLVDEKRHLTDISNLKKVKKNLSGLGDMQATIDADKAKLADLRAKLDDPESKAAQERYNEIRKKLDALREAQQSAYKNLGSLFDKRNAARAAYSETRKKIDKVKDDYYNQLRAFHEQAKADEKARIEREKAEREAQEKSHKKELAQAKLDAASEPAFAQQIDIAENLIIHFDPDYKRKGNLLTKESTLGATVRRQVEKVEGAQLLKKGDNFLLEATGGKKSKSKGGKRSDKLRLNAGIIEDLSNLNISIPTSVDDIANTVQKLKEKVQYFNENQERVTQERVERAKAEIAKIEAAEADGVSTDATNEKSSSTAAEVGATV
jgi:chromosome segregation ATPase